MDSKQATTIKQFSILEKLTSSRLGNGNLGVIMARAGAGKTAIMVQIGLEALVKEENVLHIALGQSTDHVQGWYGALFKNAVGNLEDADLLQASITKHRVIQTYADMAITPQRLEQTVELYRKSINFTPDVILIDGFDWEAMSTVCTSAAIGALRACAMRFDAELWMSAQTHRARTKKYPNKIQPPCDVYDEIIDTAVFLEPESRNVSVRILKDHAVMDLSDANLLLDCNTFRPVTNDNAAPAVKFPVSAYALLSGGARGAESEFGKCAEKFGVQEINFSFDGHQTERTRGVLTLSSSELEQGNVSGVYLNAQMHRTYPKTPLFQKILQSIWHQVNTAGEVFVVGAIMPDNTVRGGTGWAAELARHWHKPVYIFDQEKNSWFLWQKDSWVQTSVPVVSKMRFTGTGTRFLSNEGREAIHALFERSFGTG